MAALSIIHGFGEHSGRYEHMMKALAEQGIASLAMDLEGHGRFADKKGVCRNYDILRADVDMSLAELGMRFPNVPQFLFGHSLGGGLVLNYGLQQSPDIKGFIVSAPLIVPADPISNGLRVLVRTLRRFMPGVTLSNPISGDKVSSIAAEREKYEKDPLNHGRLGVGLAQDMILGGEWVADNAEHWRAPLLLMHARADKLTSFAASEAFAHQAKNCTFLPMENCEHEMHNDVTRDAVYQSMIDFIKALL